MRSPHLTGEPIDAGGELFSGEQNVHGGAEAHR
jgi:hypothetical protein